VIATKRRLHERELAAAAALATPEAPAESATTASAPTDLTALLDQQNERLAAVERELKGQRGKWRGDFWKLAFVLLLFWLAGQFGLLQKVEPHWAKVKAAVWHQVDLWKETRASSQKTTPPAAPAPAADPAPAAPANEPLGQPL
jgi:hypothetical protein